MYIWFFSPRVQEMFSQMKEVHEKVLYIKDTLLALDSQLGHLQDLSALTVDTLKVISAVDTLQVEETLLIDTKHQAYRKLPHSWSNAMYSKALSSMECMSDKKYKYYSMPPSLLRSLARTQWPSKGHYHIFDALEYDGKMKSLDKCQEQDRESDTVTSGESSKSKSAPRYGQFLLVPSGQQGASFLEDAGLNLAFSDTVNELREDKLEAKSQTKHCITATHEKVYAAAAAAEKKSAVHQGQEVDSIIFSPVQKGGETELSLAVQTPSNSIDDKVFVSSHPSSEEPQGGYVNWGFSEDDEKGLWFSSASRQQPYMHSAYNKDCNCTISSRTSEPGQIKEFTSFSYSSDRSGYSTSDSSQSSLPLQRSALFWINPLRKNRSFYKGSGFQSHKAEKAEKTCKVKGNNNTLLPFSKHQILHSF